MSNLVLAGLCILCLVCGYFIGSISSGMVVAKMYHKDIRKLGSGNTGTTNVLRTLGKFPAAVTFAGDIAKVIIPIVIIRIIFGDQDFWYLLSIYYGLGAVLGHSFPFYMGFKGGKGIAVTAAVIIATTRPIIIILGLLAFIIVVAVTRYVSVGSLLVVALLMPVNTIVFHMDNPYFVHSLIISCLITAVDYFRHRENIVRLIHGTENKLF